MKIPDLQEAVKKKKFAPLYLFTGSEDFLIDEGIRLIVEHALEPSMRSFNLDVMYGSKSDVKDVVAHASAFPMMSERRVVIVKEAEKLATSESDMEVLGAYLQRPLESTSLVFVAPEGDMRKKPFTDIKKHAEVIECKPLFDSQIPPWIAEHIRRMGKEASLDACRLLQAYVGNSLRVLQSEIEKLITFVGARSEIKTKDVTAVAGATKGYTVFDLQDAIGAKDMRTAMRILEKMMQSSEQPTRIIIMLTRFFTQLWKLQDLRLKRSPDSEIASLIGVPSYYLKKYVAYQSKFSPGQIERAFRALLEADTTLKTISRDPKLVMELLVYELINGSRQRETAVS